MLPITAIPIAPPTSRERSFSAEPTPCWAGGSASVIALVAGRHRRSHPDPEHNKPAGQQPVAAGVAELGDDREPRGDQDQAGRRTLSGR